MDPPRIDALSAAILPPPRFAAMRWYRATSSWYYHRLADRPPADRRDAMFYDRLDPALRPLVRLLHRLGLDTTPSCEGHFYPRSHFKAIWQHLRRERWLIRTRGLIVHDSETGERHRFHAPHYELPWPDAAAFCAEAMAQQQVGYLGVLAPPRHKGIVDQLFGAVAGLTGVSCLRQVVAGRAVVGLRVDTGDPGAQVAAWTQIAERLIRQRQAIRQSRGAAG